MPTSVANKMKHTTLQEEAELSSMQLIAKHAQFLKERKLS